MRPVNLICAFCENYGIGVNGDLPWRLKKEMEHFNKATSKTKNVDYKNATIMGRKTWESIPKKFKPLKGRLNVVITSRPENFTEQLAFNSVQSAINELQDVSKHPDIESLWIIGGYGVYKEAIDKDLCNRLYLTQVNRHFECDTFFPQFPKDNYKIVNDPEVPQGIQDENDLTFEVTVYERKIQEQNGNS